MNKAALLFALTLLVSGSVLGAPMCMPDTLAGYIGLGSGGCEIAGATFSGFATLPPITGAQAIPATAISVSPTASGTTVGLDLRVDATAASGQILQALFGYMLSGRSFISDSITLSGVTATGGAIVTDIQNYCAGGSFLPGGVTGCRGTAGDLVVLNSGTDQAVLPGVSNLAIVHDLTLDAGVGGTATAGMISDRFTVAADSAPIPEPQTYLLMTSALLFLALRSRSSKKLCRKER